ncbi:MAG: Asp-tRNA(Asn)/Glu-tRNA(Gln) amidotransferase subunit GatC [Clostridia bacterium]|nr:Asp-tRNA(Asn)/Glu-tRNA(Gln) amidotransferase subunit GatC [Clostridia bacterium]
MQVSKEEILHIANLAMLNIEENEIEKYRENLNDILDFAETIKNAKTENIDITIGANEAKNIFRKDEIKKFEDTQSLLQNAPSQNQNMFKIPKVIQ